MVRIVIDVTTQLTIDDPPLINRAPRPGVDNLRESVVVGRVSVIIPLYNHEKYIAQAVESVLVQGELLKELIVIDDGSTDRSASIMEQLSSRDSRISFFKQDNCGAHATINRGLALATGEFVAILNSDDCFVPGRLAALVRALDLDVGSDLASSSIGFFNGDGNEIQNEWFDSALGKFFSRRDIAVSLIDANYLMTTSNFLMRASLLKKVGFFAALRYAHDLEFALRCRAHDIRFCFINKTLLKYRFHNSNTISENHTKVRAEWALCAASYLHQRYLARGEDDAYADIKKVISHHGLSDMVEIALNAFKHAGVFQLTDAFMAESKILDQITKAA